MRDRLPVIRSWCRLAAPLLLTLPAAMPACSSPSGAARRVVDSYILAIQERDNRRLISLSAPMSRRLGAAPAPEREAVAAAIESEIDARQAAYSAGRDRGWLDFDADGIVLVQALSLGRGAYYQTVATASPAPDRMVIVQEVRLAYRSIRVDDLPWGTTIYLLGEPLGTVHHPIIGARQAAVRRLLETVWIRWHLVRRQGGWLVESVVPDDRPPISYNDSTRF